MMHRAPATWEKNTSLATKVVNYWSPRFAGEKDVKLPQDERAMGALDVYNAQRVADCSRAIWSLQNLAKDHCGTVKADAVAEEPAGDAEESDAAPDADAGKSQLDVVLAAIAHLTDAELDIASDAIAAARVIRVVRPAA